MIIRYKHTFNKMFDNKVATKIARIWNPLQSFSGISFKFYNG